MWKVLYRENGEDKESRLFGDRDLAFLFQSGLLARRRRLEGGGWDVEVRGVYAVEPPEKG